MSRALVCDNCETALPLNAHGESDDGEDSAWIVLSLAAQRFDLCTRSCVVEFLERPEVIASHDEYAEAITGIARVIREGREQEGDDDD